MTVRTAELLMGIITLVISIAIMLKSAQLSIGWIPERGPGSGMWPFWLSLGMAFASVATLIRWFLGLTPESRNTAPYVERDTILLVVITALSVFGLILGMRYIGTYFAMMLFLAFYLRVVGRHSWKAVAVFVMAVPTCVYLLFEVALTKYLPKGLEPFEEAFLFVDDIRYDIQYSGMAWTITGAMAAWVGLSILVGLHAERRGRNGVLAFLLSVVASPVLGFAVYHFALPDARAAGDGSAAGAAGDRL